MLKLVLDIVLGVVVAQLPRELALLLCGFYRDPELPPWYRRLFRGQRWLENYVANATAAGRRRSDECSS